MCTIGKTSMVTWCLKHWLQTKFEHALITWNTDITICHNSAHGIQGVQDYLFCMLYNAMLLIVIRNIALVVCQIGSEVGWFFGTFNKEIYLSLMIFYIYRLARLSIISWCQVWDGLAPNWQPPDVNIGLARLG